MSILVELSQMIRELDELNCQDCGEELETEEDFDNGVCSTCRYQNSRGSQFDGAREEDCQMAEVYYTDTDGNILTEAAQRMFKLVGTKIIRKYRCLSGPKKGKPVSDPSKCATRKDPGKVRQGRKNMRRGKATRKRKAKITRKTTKSKMAGRLNAGLKGVTGGTTPTPKKKSLSPSSKSFKPLNGSKSTIKATKTVSSSEPTLKTIKTK